MPWLVIFDDGFVPEFLEWRRDVRKAASVAISALEHAGPLLNRPQADTLHGSRDANMKELRFSTRDGEWRIAYAFDPLRNAILLVGGDKSGGAQARFYRRLVATADARFEAHLAAARPMPKG